MRLLPCRFSNRNDRPDEFGFTLDNETGGLEAVLATLEKSCTQKWQEAVASDSETKLIQSLAAQSAQVVGIKVNLTTTDPRRDGRAG